MDNPLFPINGINISTMITTNLGAVHRVFTTTVLIQTNKVDEVEHILDLCWKNTLKAERNSRLMPAGDSTDITNDETSEDGPVD